MGRRGHIWTRKGSDVWRATIGGRQVPLSADRREAERMFHALKAEHREVVKAGVTLAVLCDLYWDFLEREREPSTIAWYRKHLKSFLSHAGKTTAAAVVQPKHVSAWLAAHPGWGANYRRSAISIVKRLYSWGATEGHVPGNTLRDVEKPPPVYREAFLTNTQADRILAFVADEPFRDFLTALRMTGCRPGEIANLTADRVDLSAGTWSVVNKTRRKTGGKYRPVYLNPAVIEMSRRLVAEHEEGPVFRNTRGDPWTQGNIVMRFCRIREELGLGPEAVAYSFRHLYITDALERGVPPATVAELVGHRTLDMIMRVYSKLKHRTDHLREAARMVRPG